MKKDIYSLSMTEKEFGNIAYDLQIKARIIEDMYNVDLDKALSIVIQIERNHLFENTVRIIAAGLVVTKQDNIPAALEMIAIQLKEINNKLHNQNLH